MQLGGSNGYVDQSAATPQFCRLCAKLVKQLRAHLLHTHSRQFGYYLHSTDYKLRVLELSEREPGGRRP